MAGNNFIWLNVFGTYLSILDHFGFKQQSEQHWTPVELEAGA